MALIVSFSSYFRNNYLHISFIIIICSRRKTKNCQVFCQSIFNTTQRFLENIFGYRSNNLELIKSKLYLFNQITYMNTIVYDFWIGLNLSYNYNMYLLWSLIPTIGNNTVFLIKTLNFNTFEIVCILYVGILVA